MTLKSEYQRTLTEPFSWLIYTFLKHPVTIQRLKILHSFSSVIIKSVVSRKVKEAYMVLLVNYSNLNTMTWGSS